MEFRQEGPGEKLLGSAYMQKEAFYAIKPPITWKKKDYKGDEKTLQYPLSFRDPKSKDSLTIGLIQGGPPTLTLESLSRFRGDYLGALRKRGLGKIIGSDLYQFKHFLCIQLLAERGNDIVLQLLVFNDPGSFLQLAYSLDKNHYHEKARVLEASIASLEWPIFPGK
jgi:hypothetical protein